MGDGPDFLGRAVTPVMSGLGNFAEFYRSPSADTGLICAVTEAIKRVFIRGRSSAHKIRTVAVGGEGNQVTCVAVRTLDAMADADGHQSAEVHVVSQCRWGLDGK